MVAGAPVDSPPPSPSVGDQYLVGDTPEDAFAEHAQNLATWTEAGWLFTPPREMMSVVDGRSGQAWFYRGGEWLLGMIEAAEGRVDGQKVLGSRQSAIPVPTGGTVVDQESRAALAAMLSALRQHGLIAT
ncbi:DUF2793 domain-containing protein [Sphingomonas ginsengisoli (ex An et al. 2013)]|uniref:DUF2793 domain-containing protein n=1 Tax=Sphingomonas ginsengisoli (ex An et al. 2013) TaxID=363835 RepID=UPI0013B3BF82|nr:MULTISPECIES: DUF2793 domain-containing protein [Sphingomonas]